METDFEWLGITLIRSDLIPIPNFLMQFGTLYHDIRIENVVRIGLDSLRLKRIRSD